MVTASVITICLITALLVVNWKIAMGTSLFLGACYALLGLATRKELKLNSKLIANASQKQIQILSEGLGAIRDVIL